jgi:hypothetical protein
VVEQQERRQAREAAADPAAGRLVQTRMAAHQRPEQRPEPVGDVEVVDAGIVR